jgi:hypothetical protein
MKGGWLLLLGGLLIWAAHFLALYIIGEFAGETEAARLAIGMLTLAALIGDIAVLRWALSISIDTEFDRWRRSLVAAEALLSAIAIIWQSLPSII